MGKLVGDTEIHVQLKFRLLCCMYCVDAMCRLEKERRKLIEEINAALHAKKYAFINKFV